MTASRDSADCNTAGQVCVGNAELSQPCALLNFTMSKWLSALRQEQRTAQASKTSKMVSNGRDERLCRKRAVGSTVSQHLAPVTSYLALFLHDLTFSKTCHYSNQRPANTQTLLWGKAWKPNLDKLANGKRK